MHAERKGYVITSSLLSTSAYETLCNLPCIHYYFLSFSQQLYEVVKIAILTFLVSTLGMFPKFPKIQVWA